MSQIPEDVADLTRRTAEANAALVRGDIDGYLALVEHATDYTLMAPLGGATRRGFDTSSENRAATARFFRSGTFDQEVVAAYGSGDLVVLATIERVQAEIGGLPRQDWSLRVTQVFRRDGAKWQLVHRHADPLVDGISLQRAAAFARGDRRGGATHSLRTPETCRCGSHGDSIIKLDGRAQPVRCGPATDVANENCQIDSEARDALKVHYAADKISSSARRKYAPIPFRLPVSNSRAGGAS